MNKTYKNHKFCYICGSIDGVTFHHFRNNARKTKDLPEGAIKKGAIEGIPLCREHHDAVEEAKNWIKKYKKLSHAYKEGYNNGLIKNKSRSI